MPLNALVEGQMTRAHRDGPRTAECFECGAPMVAKTGDIIVWHWAHRAENPDCGLSGESEWHLTWKACGLEGSQEVPSESGKRRADVLNPMGFAVEFQKSPLNWQEVRARELDWEHRLIWVIETHSGVRTGQIIMRSPTSLTWYRCPATVRHMVVKGRYPGCRTFLDLGDRHGLFYAESRRAVYGGETGDDEPGQVLTGFRVSREAFIDNVLHAISPSAIAGMSLRPDSWRPIRELLDEQDGPVAARESLDEWAS